MKKTLLFLTVISLLTACSSSENVDEKNVECCDSTEVCSDTTKCDTTVVNNTTTSVNDSIK